MHHILGFTMEVYSGMGVHSDMGVKSVIYDIY